MAAHSVVTEEKEIPQANTGKIWRTFWILFAITTLEFIIAFAKESYPINHTLVIVVFISLTLVKAFYIIAEFMHLAHEVKLLTWSLLLPLIFLIWLIVALIYEGEAMLALLQ